MVLHVGPFVKPQQTSSIPNFCQLQILIPALTRKRRPNRGVITLTMKKKPWFLKREPQGAIQMISHRPLPLSNELQPGSVERPVGDQLRVLILWQNLFVLAENSRLVLNIALAQLRVEIEKPLQMQKGSSQFRARAAWDSIKLLSALSYERPQPRKNAQLQLVGTPLKLCEAREPAKVEKVQSKDQNMKQSLLGNLASTT